MSDKTLTIRFPDNLAKKLEKEAVKKDLTVSQIVRALVRAHLGDN